MHSKSRMHRKHFPTSAHPYEQQRLTQETAVQMGNLSASHIYCPDKHVQSYNSLCFVVSGYSVSGSNSLRPPNWRGLALLPPSVPRSPAAHLALVLVAGCFHREAIHLANLAKD